MKIMLHSCAALLVFAGAFTAARADETNSPPNVPLLERPEPPAAGLGDGLLPPNVLTDEQRASMTQALQSQRNKVRELQAKLRDARRELWSTGLTGTFDEDAVRKQAQAIANLETEMTVLRVKALSKIQPPLSAEQIEKIRNAPAAAGRMGPRAGVREPGAAAPRRSVVNPRRDQNDLPPKQ